MPGFCEIVYEKLGRYDHTVVTVVHSQVVHVSWSGKEMKVEAGKC